MSQVASLAGPASLLAGMACLVAKAFATRLAKRSALLTLAFSVASIGHGAAILRFGTDAAARQGDSHG